MYSEILAERDGYRVSLVVDENADKPYNDGATPILTLEHSGYGGYRVEAFNRQAEEYVHAVAEIVESHGLETLERFVKIFYGAVKLDSEWSDGISGYYVAFDTADWRETVGAPIAALQTENYLSEVMAWANGDVWGYVVDKSVPYTKTYGDGTTVEESEWDDVDSCYGYYGREYAEEAALEALDTFIEYERDGK